MSWVDLIILIVVVLAGLRGLAEGFIRQISGVLGLGAGFFLGVAIAPTVSKHLWNNGWRPAVALFIVLVVSVCGGIIGGVVGGFIARLAHALLLGIVDRIAGAVLGVVGALLICWLAAGLLVSATWGSIASGIQQSAILKAMDGIMPPVPEIEARVETLFPNAQVPNVFANVVAPTLRRFLNPKELGPNVTPLSSPSDVVKVIASGACGSTSQGTAFFVTSDEVVTNAHVVAGFKRFTVNGASAEVALFDPINDLAVLRVPAANATPLHFSQHEPSPGTHVEVVGYPLDAGRTGSPGVYEGELSGQGRDIYNKTLVTKSILAVEVNVQPGNSGSPVLDSGMVTGVVEAKLLSEASTAYAIPDSVVEHDVAEARATGTVSTESCIG
jgi:uncharacterized membrane protein required for colicin V production